MRFLDKLTGLKPKSAGIADNAQYMLEVIRKGSNVTSGAYNVQGCRFTFPNLTSKPAARLLAIIMRKRSGINPDNFKFTTVNNYGDQVVALDIRHESCAFDFSEAEDAIRAFRTHAAHGWRYDEENDVYTKAFDPEVPDLSEVLELGGSIISQDPNAVRIIEKQPGTNPTGRLGHLQQLITDLAGVEALLRQNSSTEITAEMVEGFTHRLEQCASQSYIAVKGSIANKLLGEGLGIYVTRRVRTPGMEIIPAR